MCLVLFITFIQVIGMEEDVSVYDIADHPDFHFRTTDIVIRIWNSENGQNDCENEVWIVKNIFPLSVCHINCTWLFLTIFILILLHLMAYSLIYLIILVSILAFLVLHIDRDNIQTFQIL